MSFTDEQSNMLRAPLDPNAVKQRQGSGNRSLSYIEGWQAIANANAIFGFDGWSTEITSLHPVVAPDTGLTNYSNAQGNVGYLVAYTARVRVTVVAGSLTVVGNPPVAFTSHEDVGYGEGIDYNNLGQAHESAVKEAVTDAEKRALRHWGNQFGLSLYDKDSPERQQAASTAPRQQQSGPDIRKVTEPQVKRLYAIAASRGVTDAQIKEALMGYGVESARDLSRNDYDHLCARLEGLPAAKPAAPAPEEIDPDDMPF